MWLGEGGLLEVYGAYNVYYIYIMYLYLLFIYYFVYCILYIILNVMFFPWQSLVLIHLWAAWCVLHELSLMSWAWQVGHDELDLTRWVGPGELGMMSWIWQGIHAAWVELGLTSWAWWACGHDELSWIWQGIHATWVELGLMSWAWWACEHDELSLMSWVWQGIHDTCHMLNDTWYMILELDLHVGFGKLCLFGLLCLASWTRQDKCYMDLSWIWQRKLCLFGLLCLASWTRQGKCCVGLSWIWQVVLGELGLTSWVGFGKLCLVSWVWRVGFDKCWMLHDACYVSCILDWTRLENLWLHINIQCANAYVWTSYYLYFP